MPKELTGQYNPKETEDKIYREWEKSGYFDPDKLPILKKLKTYNLKPKTFSVTMAPPNVTGSLHMGHALEYTLSDILVRFKRMSGFQSLWLPGTDHAGIATQNVVERELKKQGISRHDLGRGKFLEKVWEWKEKYGDTIINQLKKLGVSADWTRARFTMDPDYARAVTEAFKHYHKKGWIYQGERTVNWCPRCATSLSDLEIEYREENAEWYEIKYGPLVIGTVRPETKLGDTAVAVHPKDRRYKKYIGREIEIDTVLELAKMKVVADPEVDINFGTGVMKVTPAHDHHDFELAEKYGLEKKQVIGPDGRMTKLAGKYAGLTTADAREQIVKDLENKELLINRKPYQHRVAVCYRCNAVLEPILSKQWFLKMDALAQKAIRAVKSDKVRFRPKRWEKIYLDWLKNIKDWCISRQIWWGHKIPIKGVEDVLDTWFSSALWPFATLGWPKKTKDLKRFYPTNLITNDRGIINLWDARMVFSGLEFMGKIPFKDIMVHATILTKDGQRMSKSLGTGIDPMNLINNYGADATRFGLVWQAMGGQDIRWSEEHVLAGKKFCNKIWNASRFVLMRLPATSHRPSAKPKPLTTKDKKILRSLGQVKKGISEKIDKYEFGQALRELYNFFWHDFCDQYLESAKIQMTDGKKDENTQKILLYILTESLKLLHPFMPFITEEIWRHLPLKNKNLLLIEKWPK